ncbi:MAG TPA: general secretion pathway protein GspB [Rhodanobacteraceae bacterium]|jgi:general secretion pathway protein B|nr:general secretion pathway protein GspB [Rhodanobacteraceae bacterium]
MSLILEALKKSEQQRRLGETPTLASPVVATRRRRSFLPVLAILVIAASATAWWLLRPTHAPSPSAQPPSPVAAPGTKPAAAANPAPSSPVAAQGQKPVVAANPAPPAPAMVTDRRTQDRAKLAAEGARRNGLRTEEEKRLAGIGTNARATPPPAAPATAKGAAPAVPTTPAPPVAQKPADSAAAPASPPAPAPVEGHAVAVAPPASGATDVAAPTPKTDKTADAVPSIWDLPFATRKDLPAIDLSMHVYSADPKQRFVVIKGERRVEGDEVGSDLILREIRQDGLVLDYKGQRFFFPRSGR